MAVTTARAVGVVEPGGPDVLHVVEREVREPGAGEVRIAVRAAAVNPTDIGCAGAASRAWRRPGCRAWTPPATVESVGAGVEHVAPGDEVMAAVLPRRPEGGAQAELIVVPARSVVPRARGRDARAGGDAADERPHGAARPRAARPPRGLERCSSPEAPACLRRTRSRSRNGQGLRVLADASPADEALVRSFGADVVLPRGEPYPRRGRATASSTPPCADATPSARSAPAAGSRSCARGTAAMSRTG